MKKRTCPVCGKHFFVNGKGVFCGQNCRIKSHRNKAPIVTPIVTPPNVTIVTPNVTNVTPNVTNVTPNVTNVTLSNAKFKETDETRQLVDLFNKKYSFVLEDGKPVVWFEQYDEELDRMSYVKVSRETFVQMYENNWIKVADSMTEKACFVTHAEVWLGSPKRRQYLGGTVFDPNPEREENPDFLNLWKGWAVEPKKGNWDAIESHIFDVVCGGNETLYSYTIQWLATLFQQPHKQIEVALILRGEKGCGKGLLGHFIRNLFGNAGLHINNACHLIGRFNTHLRTTAFLFVDEAIWAGNHEHENILKTLVTDTTLTIEEKHGAVRNRRNRLSILMCSNNDWVIPASTDERRYAVLDVSSKEKGNRAYMSHLAQKTHDKSVQAAFLYEMLNLDLSKFEIRDIPETQGLSDQRAHSLPSVGQWWIDVLTSGQIYYSKWHIADFTEWRPIVSTELMYLSYCQYCQQMNIRNPQSKVELGKFMKKIYKPTYTRELLLIGERPANRHEPVSAEYSTSKKQTYAYQVGTWQQAREQFTEKLKIQLPELPEEID
jgi:Leucine-rich repeat (LRR) protein